jgi:hypothetical protein
MQSGFNKNYLWGNIYFCARNEIFICKKSISIGDRFKDDFFEIVEINSRRTQTSDG